MRFTERLLVPLVVVAVVAVAAAVAAYLTGRGSQAVIEATLFVGILAALGALGAVVVTVGGNADTARSLKELATNQGDMAKDIRTLTTATQTSIADTQSRKPGLSLAIIVKDGATTAAAEWTRKRLDRSVDLEAIVQSERAAALATLPKLPADVTEAHPLYSYLENSARLLAMIGEGPPTAEERADFAKEVDGYERELRAWLAKYADWWREAPKVSSVRLRFENSGRVPAEGLRIYVTFPHGCSVRNEAPKLGNPPSRPRYHRSSFADLIGGGILGPSRLSGLHGLGAYREVVRRNVTGPLFTEGSGRVEFRIEKLLHGVPDDSGAPVSVSIPEDGELKLLWEARAENLDEPVAGSLTLVVSTAAVTGPSIATLAELIELVAPSQRESVDDDE